MKTMNLKIAMIFVVLIISSFLASALTASIGNARMILNYTLEKDKENVIEKTILVRNVNNVSVLVNLKPDAAIKDITEIPENNVTLEPNSDKDFIFRIRPTQPGEIEGKINVFFSDPSGKQTGVVLTSTIIMYVLGEGTTIQQNNNNTIKNQTNNNTAVVEDVPKKNATGVRVSVGGSGGSVVNGEENKDANGVSWFFISFIVLLSIIFLAIIIIILRRE